MLLTAARPKGRQAAILLKYENKDISAEIAPDIESFRYTDVAASQSDSVSITVNARAKKWKNDWMPEKGVKLYPTIAVKDWNIGGYRDYSAECGTFVLDDLSFSSTPDTLTMGGVAKPNDTSFSERNRTFTWKKTSVKKIAEEIAGRYGLELKFDGDDHDIDAKEQDATDSAFLQDLCDTYATPMHWLSRCTRKNCGCMTGKSTRPRMPYGRYTRWHPLQTQPLCAWKRAALSGARN